MRRSCPCHRAHEQCCQDEFLGRAHCLPPSSFSVSQCKSDVDDSRKIYRLTLLLSRLEANLLRCSLSRIIQTVTEPLNYALDLNVSASGEYDLQENVTFDFLVFGFVGIDRFRLEQDFHRRRLSCGRCYRLCLGRWRSRSFICEARRLN